MLFELNGSDSAMATILEQVGLDRKVFIGLKVLNDIETLLKTLRWKLFKIVYIRSWRRDKNEYASEVPCRVIKFN